MHALKLIHISKLGQWWSAYNKLLTSSSIQRCDILGECLYISNYEYFSRLWTNMKVILFSKYFTKSSTMSSSRPPRWHSYHTDNEYIYLLASNVHNLCHEWNTRIYHSVVIESHFSSFLHGKKPIKDCIISNLCIFCLFPEVSISCTLQKWAVKLM